MRSSFTGEVQHDHKTLEGSRAETPGGFVLPDPPEGEPEDMTSFDHLTLSGSVQWVRDRPSTPCWRF